MVRRHLRTAILLVGVLVLGAGSATPAFAWSNGPNYGRGFGTHDWVLAEAQRLAGSPSWLETSTALAATDDPDMLFQDWYYHAYDVWGRRYGNAPARIGECYTLAVKAYRAKDYDGASTYVGLLSHYFADICQPLHTDKVAAEQSMHGEYEEAVDLLTSYAGERRGWIRSDGYQRVTNVQGKARGAASFAHRWYWSLVSNYTKAGMNPSVGAITRVCLNRAANDLADIIRSVPSAKVPLTGSVGSLPSKSAAGVSGSSVSRGTATVGGVFVGSENSNQYHYPNCTWGAGSRRTTGSGPRAPNTMRLHGYVPCKVCDPPWAEAPSPL